VETRAVEARGELDAETGERVVEIVPRPGAAPADELASENEPAPELSADSG
jgi:hypothetical protein